MGGELTITALGNPMYIALLQKSVLVRVCCGFVSIRSTELVGHISLCIVISNRDNALHLALANKERCQ